MERSEFDRLLQQFPVVRSKQQHRRDWYAEANTAAASSSSSVAAASAVPAAAASAPAASAAPASVPAAASSTGSIATSLSSNSNSSGSDFYAQLSSFLRASGYSDSVTSATVGHFRDAHRQTLAGLALDEIEIIAQSIGAARQQRQQQCRPAAAAVTEPAASVDASADLMVD